MINQYGQERQVAIAAVRMAARLCQQVRHNRSSHAIAKSDRSPVTMADFGAQALICRALAEAFPHDPVVAEESATLLRQPEQAERLQQIAGVVQPFVPEATPAAVADWIDRGNGQVSDRYWTLDPIDGTKGFLRGDQYAIALALIDQGEVKLGVLGCPALSVDGSPFGAAPGLLYVAVRGEGTDWMALEGDRTVPVSMTPEGDAQWQRLIESVEVEHGNPSLQRRVAEQVGLTVSPLPMDSQAKYGMVACGRAALYLRLRWAQEPTYQENIWDHAAGAIVVEEAGGRVTDMDGKPLDFSSNAKLVNNRGIVASNGLLHETVLAVLRGLAQP